MNTEQTVLWAPHKGPQSVFLSSSAYEVLYGGMVGGGKSDCLLFGALRQIAHPQYRALILRRTFPELRELMDRSLAVFGELGGEWNEQAKRWRFPSGAVIEFGYCIHGSTPVLMADGRYRDMAAIRAGDLVATLEGPRRVKRHWAVGRRQAVEFRLGPDYPGSGSVVGSAHHAVLASDGLWVTPADAARDARNGCTTSSLSSPGQQRPASHCARLTLCGPAPQSRGIGARDSEHLHADGHDRQPPALEDSLADCRGALRSGGGLALLEEEVAPARTRLQAGADRCDRTPARADGLTSIRECSRSGSATYSHPYTSAKRSAVRDVHHADAEMVPVGEQALWDMSVEGANHYITIGGVVHKNCEFYRDVMRYQGQQYAHIAFDELGQVAEERIWTYLMTRNRAAAEGLAIQMRASANPGGAGHHWLKRRFIDACPPDGTPVHVGTGTRAFVRASIFDNPTLVKNDPTYLERLKQLPELEYKWLALGDWHAGGGLAFPELGELDRYIVQKTLIPGHWKCFASFDWGYAHPWAFGLFAVDDDGTVYLVDSCHGRKQQPPEIAERWKRTIDANHLAGRCKVVVAGHDCWADIKARGERTPTLAEAFYAEGFMLTRANISRVAGVQNLRSYFSCKDARPRFRLFDTPGNRKVMENVASRIADPDDVEDVMKTDADDSGIGGDDPYDMLRYGLAARPIRATLPLSWRHDHAPHHDPSVILRELKTIDGKAPRWIGPEHDAHDDGAQWTEGFAAQLPASL